MFLVLSLDLYLINYFYFYSFKRRYRGLVAVPSAARKLTETFYFFYDHHRMIHQPTLNRLGRLSREATTNQVKLIFTLSNHKRKKKNIGL